MNIDLQIERWLIEQLIPRATNPRTHSPEQVAQIAGSIKEWGWTNPILVGAENDIIAGHARLMAARQLGMTEVPVIVLRHLSEAQRRALVIADNQLALNSGWDEELLRLELALLQEQGYDLDLTGFDADELAELMADQGGSTDVDQIPEAPVIPVTVAGDIWQLGSHRLICGDSTSAADVERLLNGAQPSLMVTDPPYGIELDSEWRDRAGLNGCGPAEGSYMKHRTEGHKNTSISSDTRADWSEAFELVPSLQAAYVWYASKFTREVLDGLLRIGFLHHQQIIWDRGGRSSRAPITGSSTSPAGMCGRRTRRGSGRRERTRLFGTLRRPSLLWAAPARRSSIIRRKSRSS